MTQLHASVASGLKPRHKCVGYSPAQAGSLLSTLIVKPRTPSLALAVVSAQICDRIAVLILARGAEGRGLVAAHQRCAAQGRATPIVSKARVDGDVKLV